MTVKERILAICLEENIRNQLEYAGLTGLGIIIRQKDTNSRHESLATRKENKEYE